MKRFIGFYWTLPVPWAGFRDVPKDVDAAAELSQTIRYQRDRVRSWVKSEKGTMTHEEVFVDLQPDRGTEQVVPVIDRLLTRCAAEHAELVLVDFSDAFGWRRHGPLWDRLGNGKLCTQLDPAPITIDGVSFDPVGHFRAWRELEEAHASSKSARKDTVMQAVEGLLSDNPSMKALAQSLNEAGHRTPNDKPWTEDNLRKFLKWR
jgi:hypothetical protein